MKELRMVSVTGGQIVLKHATIESFRTAVRGDLLFQGDPGYDNARKIHNGMIDRRPALIVRCAGVADVLAAVRLARENQLLLSIRGGGHSVPGFAVCDGGLMIDLTRMRSVRVDPTRRTARAESGATWGDFDPETQAFGLATTGGTARPTGIAGLTLAGGHGFLMRKHGLTCDNLLSVDIVTADGQLRTASASENADLFWGLRGGGGNFGVVTSFEYQLHPVGPMFGGLLIYPMAEARRLLKFFEEFTRTMPDELGTLAVLGTLPDGTRVIVFFLAYNGPADKGEAALRPLRTFGTPLQDQIGTMPYTVLQSIVENFNPPNRRNYWKTTYLNDLNDEAIDVMVDRYESVPHPLSHVVIGALGGAMSRVSPDTTAVAYRDARHALLVVGMWDEPAGDESTLGWVREFWNAMQPFSSGGFYVNYDADTTPDRVQAAYGAEKYRRLVELKTKYDPTNLFRLNQNIRPAT